MRGIAAFAADDEPDDAQEHALKEMWFWATGKSRARRGF